jgi:hypothetical protein
VLDNADETGARRRLDLANGGQLLLERAEAVLERLHLLTALRPLALDAGDLAPQRLQLLLHGVTLRRQAGHEGGLTGIAGCLELTLEGSDVLQGGVQISTIAHDGRRWLMTGHGGS